MKYKVIVEYIGTNFSGYQKQINEYSIQEEIEKNLSMILREDIKIRASGRTDKGVHALGQVFDFISDNIKDKEKVLYSVNSVISKDIRLKSIEEVADSFSARLDAKSKTYLYRISLGGASVFERDYCLEVYKDFDLNLFKESLHLFVGKHNFQNFTSKEEDTQNFIREIYFIKVEQKGNILNIYLNGTGFMRYMVRYIIGMALDVAMKKTTLLDVKNRLNCEKRLENRPFKVDSKGLFLLDVLY